MLPTVPSSEGRKNFLEAVPVIAEVKYNVILPSLMGQRFHLGVVTCTRDQLTLLTCEELLSRSCQSPLFVIARVPGI